MATMNFVSWFAIAAVTDSGTSVVKLHALCPSLVNWTLADAWVWRSPLAYAGSQPSAEGSSRFGSLPVDRSRLTASRSPKATPAGNSPRLILRKMVVRLNPVRCRTSLARRMLMGVVVDTSGDIWNPFLLAQ